MCCPLENSISSASALFLTWPGHTFAFHKPRAFPASPGWRGRHHIQSTFVTNSTASGHPSGLSYSPATWESREIKVCTGGFGPSCLPTVLWEGFLAAIRSSSWWHLKDRIIFWLHGGCLLGLLGWLRWQDLLLVYYHMGTALASQTFTALSRICQLTVSLTDSTFWVLQAHVGLTLDFHLPKALIVICCLKHKT